MLNSTKLLSDVVFVMLINVKQVSYVQEDKQVMKQCINMALNLPDFSYREKDGKYLHIKHFKFSVGHLGFAKRPTNKIKVVFCIEQHHITVVSAFPCIYHVNL